MWKLITRIVDSHGKSFALNFHLCIFRSHSHLRDFAQKLSFYLQETFKKSIAEVIFIS